MTLIIFYKDGNVFARKFLIATIEKNVVSFLIEDGARSWGRESLDYIKKVVCDGVTIWENTK